MHGFDHSHDVITSIQVTKRLIKRLIAWWPFKSLTQLRQMHANAEAKLTRVLLDNPGATSSDLTLKMSWEGQS